MRPLPIIALVSAVLATRVAVADQVLQECEIWRAAPEQGPELVRSYMRNHNDVAIRRCQQIDFGTDTYYALSPVAKTDDVCRFTQNQILPAVPEAPAELRFMLLSNEDHCPGYESKGYVPVHGASEGDFAAIMDFLKQVASSDPGLAVALGRLPDEQKESKGLLDLKRLVSKEGRFPVTQIARVHHLPGIRSIFDVAVDAPGDDSHFYVLRIRRLFGNLRIVDFGSSNM